MVASRLAFGVLVLLLASCSSTSGDGADAGSASDAPAPADSPAQPVSAAVVILKPTGLASFTTLDDHLTISGVTFGPIDSVTFQTDRGASGSAVGTSTWSATIPVQPGSNVVTVLATGPGAQAQAVLTVVRNTTVQFGTPELEPPGAFVQTSTPLKVRVTLAGQVQPGTVRLVRVAGDGTETPLGPLTDDGDVTHGDEVQGDHVFSGMLTLSEPQPGPVHVRALADVSGGATEPSPVAEVPVVAPLTDAQIDAMQQGHQGAKVAFDQAMVAGQGRAQAVQAAQTTLRQDPEVLVADHAPDGTGLLVVWKSGVLGTLAFAEPGTRAGSQGRGAGTPTEQEQKEVGNHKALLLSPFQDEFKATDDNSALLDLIDNSHCPHYTSQLEVDADLTFDKMRTIDQFGVVSLSSHGDSFEETQLQGMALSADLQLRMTMVGLGTTKPNTRDVVFLRGGVDKATLQRPDVMLAMLTGAVTVGLDDLGVTERFFRTFVGPLPHSLVYLGACRSLRNGDLAQALLARGAAAVVGYTDYVTTGFASGQSKALFSCLLKGEGLPPGTLASTQTCFHPATDPVKHGTLRILPADHDVSLRSAGFRNGGFEDGKVGWTGVGDARLVPGFGGASPQEGQCMALVSTGLGFTTSSGSWSQTVCVPADVKTLSFSWQLFSAEFKTYCGSQFQDNFQVTLGKPGSKPLTLLSRSIDSLCDSVTASGAAIPQDGDPDGVFTSDWKQATGLDISEFAGTNDDVELTFSVTDVGDSAYDTVVLIDGVTFSP